MCVNMNIPLCAKAPLRATIGTDILCFFFFLKIVIASIMCSYSKNDWMELSKMAEVMISLVYICFISSLPFLLVLNKDLP